MLVFAIRHFRSYVSFRWIYCIQ